MIALNSRQKKLYANYLHVCMQDTNTSVPVWWERGVGLYR